MKGGPYCKNSNIINIMFSTISNMININNMENIHINHEQKTFSFIDSENML
jgi:hypothetical protein